MRLWLRWITAGLAHPTAERRWGQFRELAEPTADSHSAPLQLERVALPVASGAELVASAAELAQVAEQALLPKVAEPLALAKQGHPPAWGLRLAAWGVQGPQTAGEG